MKVKVRFNSSKVDGFNARDTAMLSPKEASKLVKQGLCDYVDAQPESKTKEEVPHETK